MKERLRRVILFIVIVITGSVLILFDVPLIILIPLILATGFVVLVLLGAVTRSDIKSVFRRPQFKNLKKIAFLKRLDGMKFFEKKPVQSDKKPVPPKKKEGSGIKDAKNTGPVSPLRSFLSSLGSLGSVLKERSRQKRKVEHINELLDKAVSEKVKGSALAGAGKDAGAGTGTPGGSGGRGLQEQAKDQDPFLSLSGDEFDASLLDGLDDTGPLPPPSSPGPAPSPEGTGGPDLAIPEPDIPLPSLDASSETDNILKNNAGVLEEFSSLEGGESIGKDFKDLDNLDLDDIDLDIDMGDEAPAASGSSSPPAGIPATSVKTEWVPSDAPKDAGIAEDQISLQSDMSSFSKGASGSDEDLMSSLASDVKHVKKERNLSLLRDLKDFRAQATEIEDELKDTYERLNSGSAKKKAGVPPAKGMK
jgi:hypothetical protein